MRSLICFIVLVVAVVSAFSSRFPVKRSSALFLGPPKLPTDANGKPKLTLGGVFQLITMGAGAPMLGEFKEVDENGKMLFELEANNFGGETKAKYFTDGYVEDKNKSSGDDSDSPPGFWKNLSSGGRLQTEWEERQSTKRTAGAASSIKPRTKK